MEVCDVLRRVWLKSLKSSIMYLNCLLMTASWDAVPHTVGCSIVLCVSDISNRKNKDKTFKT